MRILPRTVLRDLYAEYGRDLITNPQLLQTLLSDRCVGCEAEINLLMQAQHIGVSETLQMQSALHPVDMVVQPLAEALQAHYFTPAASLWAVETWALALGCEAPQPTDNAGRRISSIDGKEQVWIPEGEFLFVNDICRVTMQLTLPGFWIDVTPVTQAEYHRFLQANPSLSVPYDLEDWGRPYNWDRYHRTPPAGKEQHPVILVTEYDAMRYADWADKRLPTFEEWVKAAGGTDGREYPWGNEFDPNRCNTREGKAGGTTPVGKYSPQGDSPYGCVDMTGNVWEWTASSYLPAPPKPVVSRRIQEIRSRTPGFKSVEGEEKQVLKAYEWGPIMCGGDWDTSGKYARINFVSRRNHWLYGGFRCVG